MYSSLDILPYGVECGLLGADEALMTPIAASPTIMGKARVLLIRLMVPFGICNMTMIRGALHPDLLAPVD